MFAPRNALAPPPPPRAMRRAHLGLHYQNRPREVVFSWLSAHAHSVIYSEEERPNVISITADLTLDEREISETFIRASGPGGQNVNKVASAVQLRFDVGASPSLPEPLKARLARLAGNRLTQDSVIVITARRFRSQERNREDARERLVALIRRAAEPPKPRRETRPSFAQREARLAAKAKRSRTKQLR